MSKLEVIIKLNIGKDICLLTEIRAIVMKLQEHDKSNLEDRYPTFFKIKKQLDRGHGESR